MTVSLLKPTTARPRTWESARDSWLATFLAKRVTEVEGKINVTHQADIQRELYINEFVRFVLAKGADIEGADINGLFIEFFKGLAENRNGYTIKVHFSYIVLFGDFLAKKGLCQKPDRASIKEIFPAIKPMKTVVPHWSEDLNAMRILYKNRHQSPGLWSACGVFLVVRGLGSRPDESIHLS